MGQNHCSIVDHAWHQKIGFGLGSIKTLKAREQLKKDTSSTQECHL